MSFLSRISLSNRGLVALATIAILIIGALVIPSLKQELYPSLEFPAVTVISPYPGASPSIIEQDVIRVSHRDSLDTLIEKGRDLEKVVLSRAVRWHLENRLVLYGNKVAAFV